MKTSRFVRALLFFITIAGFCSGAAALTPEQQTSDSYRTTATTSTTNSVNPLLPASSPAALTPVNSSQQTNLHFKFIVLGLTLATATLPIFFRLQYGNRLPAWLLLGSVSCSLLTSVAIVLAPAPAITSLILPLIMLWGAKLTLAVYLLMRASQQQLPYSRTLLAAIAPLLIAAPYEVVTHASLQKMPTLSVYCFLFYIFVHSLILGKRFADAKQQAEKLSANLADEVKQRTAELYEKNQKLEKTQRELQQVNEALKKLSITDGLTRIYNRMHFDQELRKEWRRSARLRKPVSILMIDVDHFKQLNDSAGHLAGDQALQTIARTLHNQFKRAGELVARYGGEEFVVMLPDTDQRKALAIAEGLRHNIEKLPIEYDQQTFSITVSIGISTTTPSMRTTGEHLLAAADSALYQAKNKGRNRVEVIPLLPTKPTAQPQKLPR